MKKIYLVGKVNKKGHFTGKIVVYSSIEKAEEHKQYWSTIFPSNTYVIEEHEIN